MNVRTYTFQVLANDDQGNPRALEYRIAAQSESDAYSISNTRAVAEGFEPRFAVCTDTN